MIDLKGITERIYIETQMVIDNIEDSLSIGDILNHIKQYETEIADFNHVGLAAIEFIMHNLQPDSERILKPDYRRSSIKGIRLTAHVEPTCRIVKVNLYNRNITPSHTLTRLTPKRLEKGIDLSPTSGAFGAVTVRIERLHDYCNHYSYTYVK